MAGGLFYPNINIFTGIGTKVGTTRTSIDLESTYQAESGATKPTKTFTCGGYSKLVLDLLYTVGGSETSNSIQIKIEASSDGTNYYEIVNDTTSSGTSTLDQREFTFTGDDGAATSISLSLDISNKFLKVSIKETGVSANKGTIFGDFTLLGR